MTDLSLNGAPVNDPARDGISMPETYHLVATASGTELRYTIGPAHDAEGNRSKISEEAAVGFLSEFWLPCFDQMETLAKVAN